MLQGKHIAFVFIFVTGLLALCLAGGCRTYEEGYELGMSDSTKQLYWAYQELQKDKRADQGPRYKYYTYDGQTQGNGINYDEHKIKVMVRE